MIIYFIEIPIYLFFIATVFWMLLHKRENGDFFKFVIILEY